MEPIDVRSTLMQLKNMRQFSTASKIPLRTLWSVARGEKPPKPTTLQLIEIQLKKIKPEKKEQAAAGGER